MDLAFHERDVVNERLDHDLDVADPPLKRSEAPIRAAFEGVDSTGAPRMYRDGMLVLAWHTEHSQAGRRENVNACGSPAGSLRYGTR